jgi:uncharacterized metal-binding protein YceD (DUF177 family)
MTNDTEQLHLTFPMKSPLQLSLESLEHGPTRLTGVLPGSLLGLDDEVEIRNVGEISYALTATRTGSEVLVTGSCEAPMELECVRSGQFFSTTIRESAFLRDFSIEEIGDEFDLTDEVREAVLLQLPNYPVSPEAQSDDFELPRLASDEPDDDDSSPWKDLDNLNV